MPPHLTFDKKMKKIFSIAIVVSTISLFTARGAEDPRFTDGNLGVQNSYLEGISESVLKAFDRKGWLLRGLQGVNKIGTAYVVSGFVTLDEVEKPITDKDFERLNNFFEPFIVKQIEEFEKNGQELRSRTNSFPLNSQAKGYTNNKLPTMRYTLASDESDFFHMILTFSERTDNRLVVNFTIVTTP